jgi:hypothetical protein
MKVMFLKSFSLLVVLCAGMCCPEEDDWREEYYNVNLPELVSVGEGVHSFQLADTLWVNLQIPKTVLSQEKGNADLRALGFDRFAVALYLKQVSDFEKDKIVPLAESDMVVDFGELEVYDNNNGQFTGIAVYDEKEVYALRFGILLKEIGSFYLEGSVDINNNFLIYDSIYKEEEDTYCTVEIRWGFKGLPMGQPYRFEVTD